ncbi:glycosyltransferase family 2 protein [Megalodesulfovibrio paquesii]
MPAISVVMPTYNQARFLRQAVDSVLVQTVRDLELVVVNDGSGDDTAALLDQLAQERRDPRLVIIHHPENRGASAALNTGFARARGRYLSWLASDNCYRPDCLARLLAALEAHPDCDLAYAAFANVDEDGRFLDHEFLESWWPGLLQVNPGAVGMAFLYTRRLMEGVGAYRDMVANDLDFWLRAARGYRFMYVPEVLGENRKHAGMQTVVRRDRLAEEVATLLQEDRAHAPHTLPLPRLLERVHTLRRAARQCLRAVQLALPGMASDAGTLLLVADAGETGALLAALLQAGGLPAEARPLEAIAPGEVVLALHEADATALRGRGCTVLGTAEGSGWGKDF